MGNIFGKKDSLENGNSFQKFGKSQAKHLEEQHRLLYNRTTTSRFQTKFYPENLEAFSSNENIVKISSSKKNVKEENAGEGCSYASKCCYKNRLCLGEPRGTSQGQSSTREKVKRKRKEEGETEDESDDGGVKEKKLKFGIEESPCMIFTDQSREYVTEASSPELFSCVSKISCKFNVENGSQFSLTSDRKDRAVRSAAVRARTRIRRACCRSKNKKVSPI